MKFTNFLIIFILLITCKQNKNRTQNLENIKYNSVGLIIENTEKQNDVKIFYGKIVNNDAEYYFTNEGEKFKISLDDEQLNRIKKVDTKMRNEIPSFKDCEYILWMKMADLKGENQNLKKIGINWNE
ncbi:hypothetical protein [Chryseobacterium koreense]